MRNPIRSGLLALGLAILPGSASAQTPAPAATSLPGAPASVTLPPELDRVLRDYEAHFTARDAKGLAELFVEDGWVLSPGRPAVRGRAAITAHYARSGGPLALRAIAYGTGDVLAYILGGYAPTRGAADDGKFTLTLRKVDGRWLIVSDMDNGNRQP